MMPVKGRHPTVLLNFAALTSTHPVCAESSSDVPTGLPSSPCVSQQIMDEAWSLFPTVRNPAINIMLNRCKNQFTLVALLWAVGLVHHGVLVCVTAFLALYNCTIPDML